MFQYSHTEDVDDNTYDAYDDAFSIHILEIQMMIVQYSHTEDTYDDGSDDDVTRWWFNTDAGKQMIHKMLMLKTMVQCLHTDARK